MVLARQTVLGIDQHFAHDAFQRVLHQKIVADQVFTTGHKRALAETKVEASVARCLRTPPYGANRKGFESALGTAYAATATGA